MKKKIVLKREGKYTSSRCIAEKNGIRCKRSDHHKGKHKHGDKEWGDQVAVMGNGARVALLAAETIAGPGTIGRLFRGIR